MADAWQQCAREAGRKAQREQLAVELPQAVGTGRRLKRIGYVRVGSGGDPMTHFDTCIVLIGTSAEQAC